MSQKQPILYDRSSGLRGTPQSTDDVIMNCASQQISCSGDMGLQADNVLVAATSTVTTECADIAETSGVWSRTRNMVTTATLGNVATNTIIVRTSSLTRIQARVYGVAITGTNIFDVDCSVIGPVIGTGTVVEATPVSTVLLTNIGTTVTVLAQSGQTSIRVQGPSGVDMTWYLDITTTSMGT